MGALVERGGAVESGAPSPTGGRGGRPRSGVGLRVLDYPLDDDLVRDVQGDGRARARIRPSPLRGVVLGRASDPERELFVERVLADEVPVYRRRGGGCAVVIDAGNLLVSVALPLPGIGGSHRVFAEVSRWLACALEGCGVAGVVMRGHSDLAQGDRKVGGAAIWRTRDMVLYAATILVEPDLALIERYLRHPWREPEWRRGRAHLDFVAPVRPRAEVSHLAVRLRERLPRELMGFALLVS